MASPLDGLNWGGWNADNVFNDWDLNPLAMQLGGGADGVRDTLAEQRDAYLQPKMGAYRNAASAAGGQHAAEDDATLFNDENFRNYVGGGGTNFPQQPTLGGAMTGGDPRYAGTPQPVMDYGGGKYPLSSVSGEGLMAPWTTPFEAPQGADPSVTGSFTEQFVSPGGPDPTLTAPWTGKFVAPTAEEAAQSPGWQFRLNEAMKAVTRGGASKGIFNTGRMGKELERYGQDYASNEYEKVYNRAAGEYGSAFDTYKTNRDNAVSDNERLYGRAVGEYGNRYNVFNSNRNNALGTDDRDYNRAMGEYTQAYNIFNNNQSNQYNRLAGLAGTGQTAAGQLGALGQSYANNAGNYMTDIGNAGASGLIGSTNSWLGAAANIGNNLQLGDAFRPRS